MPFIEQTVEWGGQVLSRDPRRYRYSPDLLFEMGIRDSHKEEGEILAERAGVHNCDDTYTLTVRCEGKCVECFVTGEMLLTAVSPLAERGGKAGITADWPTRFS